MRSKKGEEMLRNGMACMNCRSTKYLLPVDCTPYEHLSKFDRRSGHDAYRGLKAADGEVDTRFAVSFVHILFVLQL
jgi:hypothetical protein